MSADDAPRDVQVRLTGAYHELPEAMRRIADALMSDSLLGALWGIESMAERAHVSIGTVVRFSKRLGYKGFSDFRDALREACQIRSEGDPLEVLEAPTDPFWALTEVVRRDQDNLNRLLQTLDHATLESATQLLMRSRHRVLLGRGVSHVMCQVLAFNLTQAGLPCIAAIPSDFSNQVANLGEGDVLVVVSCAPFSRETVDAAAFARRSGIPVLAFTDRKDSPLAKSAAVTIVLPSEDFLFSFGLSTFSVLSHALAIAVASKDSAGTVRRLKAADEVAQPLFVEHWLPMQPGAIRVARPPKPPAPQPPPKPQEP
ncbi:MAG TPA: MurR/RpiR family transcriptional regulator [Thermoanaerobaculia bacterium]|nr:MurR/RpiR family transcriptional regulator [Thermoanaerobaculia bacterium]